MVRITLLKRVGLDLWVGKTHILAQGKVRLRQVDRFLHYVVLPD